MADPKPSIRNSIQPVAPLGSPRPVRPASRLPTPLSSFIGRQRELAKVADTLRRPGVRLVTLTGPGGVGKTRLAIQAAIDLADDYPDEVWFVALAPVRDAELVPDTIAQTLDLRDAGPRTAVELLREFLRDRRALLILDNFEQVLTAGPLVANLLTACPELTVLVTSRAVLRISGEHDIAIPPLQLPDPNARLTIEALLQTEAVHLFVERAQAARDNFTLTETNAAPVADLCRRLDGLPLAIELAASRINHLPVPILLQRLEQRLPLLTGGPHDQPARLRTMRNAISWSYDLLSSQEQDFFRRLAVFVAGCTLEAAEAVAAGSDDLGIDSFAAISSLVDKSLLRQEAGADGEPRFVMLETVREYGLEQLSSHAEEEEMRLRHAAYFLALAERAAPEPPGPLGAPWLPMLKTEHPNLRAALTWLGEHGEPAAFLRLACALWQFWYQHGHLREGRGWLELALARADDAPAALRAGALYKLGTLAHYQGDEERAVPVLEAGLTLSRGLGGTWATPYLLMTLGIVAVDQGRYAAAAPFLQEALPLFLRMGYRSGAALALGHLAVAAYGQGDLPRAATIGEEALRLARSLDDTWAAGLAQWFLALTACETGNSAQAATHLTDMLAVDLPEGNRESIANGLSSFAVLSTTQRMFAAAARLLGSAEALREAVGAALALPERAAYERAEVTARAALGDEVFAAAWVAGRALSLDEAAALTREVAAAATVSRPPTGRYSAADSHGLTPRELDVLRLVAQGRSNRGIAAALFISVPTVKRHISTILGKLGLPSRSAATAYAHTHDLI